MHRWLTSLLFLVLCTPFVAAGEIKWTATGTVDLVFGPGLSGVAVVSDPEEEMKTSSSGRPVTA